jgi:capsular polysaccharide export protein
MDTTIHRMLKKYSDPKNTDNINRGQEIINYIILNGLSKYNCQMSKIPKSVLGVLNHSVLVIDQAYGDQSIVSSNADDSTFYEMLITAVKENPRKNIFVKVHPESQTGGRGGFYTDSVINKAIKETGRKIFKLTEPVNPINLLKLVDKVYTCSSGFGFEALMCRKPVVCFGIPFYARLGLTDDRNPKAQEKIMITRIEELVRIVFDKFSVFRDTYTNKVISVDRALNYIVDLRNSFLKGMIR